MPAKSRKTTANPKPDTTTPLVMGQQMVDSIVLEEDVDPEYNPTNEEVEEYAKWLGMDLPKDKDLLWIAREGLKSPLPENWKPCKTVDTEEIYYFNFETGESTWDHPCDAYYRKIFEDHQSSPTHKRLQKFFPRDKADTQRAEGHLCKLFPSGQDKMKLKKARASSTLNSHNGKDDSPRPNKKAAKGLRDLTSVATKQLGFLPVRSTMLRREHATVPSEPDIAVGVKESLTSGITASSAEQHVSLTEKNLQSQQKQLAKELVITAETKKEGSFDRLKVLHNKIISEEENQKIDVNNLRELDAVRALAENRVGKLKEQLKEGLVTASTEGVEKEDREVMKGQQLSLGEVKDEAHTNQAMAHFKEKVESLETMVAALKEKLEVETKNKEEAECTTSDALKEVSNAKTQTERLQADTMILKDELKRERNDNEESRRAADDSLSDLERVKVHNEQQMLYYKCQSEELRAKLEEVQQLESKRRAEIDRLVAKQIENESRLKDGIEKLDVSQRHGLEMKREVEELVGKQIETERRLKEKEATLKELQCLESKRRAETERLRANHVEAERRLKDEEEKTRRAKKELERKMEKAQKETCKFMADAKLQAIELQKQISNLRESGISNREKENEKAAAPQEHPSSTASGAVLSEEEPQLVATTEEFEDARAAMLQVKHLTQEVLTLETALTQSREIDVAITAKLRESEDQLEVLKQQIESYREREGQAEKRIKELNQSFQSSQKLYKQTSREVNTLENDLTNCRLMIQSMADREEDAKNEKRAWSIEKLGLEHTVQSLRRQMEALSLVVKEHEAATQVEAGGGASVQLEDALMREDKLRNELDIAIYKQKSAEDEVKRVESCINREMEAKTCAEMLSKGFMQAAMTAITAFSEVEGVLVSCANDSGPPPLGSSSYHEPTDTCRQFLAKAEAMILSLGNGVTAPTTIGRTNTTTATVESDNDVISKVMSTSLKEDSEKIMDELKSETLKLSSNTKMVALKLVDVSESHSGTLSCLKKDVCDSEERERALNAAVQLGAEKLEAVQAELLGCKSERDAACKQLNCVSHQLEQAEQELMVVSRRRKDHPSFGSLERGQAKTVTGHTNLEGESPLLPTLGFGMGSCSSELRDWKERLRAEEQLLRSSGRALKNQKDWIRMRQNDLKVRRDAWRHEWSRFEESIATERKPESSSPIRQQRGYFSAAKKSLDKDITALNAVTSQLKESSRWLKHREQKVKELNRAIARASTENEGLLEMTSGPGQDDDAARSYVSCLPSRPTCSSNTSSVKEDSSFASTSIRRILRDLQEDVKELQKRMKLAVPDPNTPLNEGTQAAAFHAFQEQQLPPHPPVYIIPPLAGYACGFHVPAPPDVSPSAITRPRPHHHHQHGYYASYPRKQPFPVFHDPENLESSLEAWLNARGRERSDGATANKHPMPTQSPPNLRQLSADRREAHLAISEAVEKLSNITADMGVYRFGASCAASAVPPTAKEAMNNQSKKMSGTLSRSAAVQGLNDATKAFTNTMERATTVNAI